MPSGVEHVGQFARSWSRPLLIPPPMPSGVEHWPSRSFASRFGLIPPPMPSGVEHAAQNRRNRKRQILIPPPMPSGVEHLLPTFLGGWEPNRSQTGAQTPTQNYTLRSNISMILLRSLLAYGVSDSHFQPSPARHSRSLAGSYNLQRNITKRRSGLPPIIEALAT